jgi:hypothetical protein
LVGTDFDKASSRDPSEPDPSSGSASSGGTHHENSSGSSGAADQGGNPEKGTSDHADASGGSSGSESSSSGTSGTSVDPSYPKDCAAAASARSNVGCEFWPTVTANGVWSIFDFGIVITNGGAVNADVHITGPAGFDKRVTVRANDVQVVVLPWVADLKGPDTNACGSVTGMSQSVLSHGGAYRVTTSAPIVVAQFNSLEERGEGTAADGTPKDWSTCPAKGCTLGAILGCNSFSNDASLLLPTSTLSSVYRASGIRGWSSSGTGTRTDVTGGYLVVTATADATTVTVDVAPGGSVLAGGAEIAATAAGSRLTFTLQKAGDVAEIVGPKGQSFDLSGSLVGASAPVQVISGIACIELPIDKTACDHVEETVLPQSALGTHYVLAAPTGPKGTRVPRLLRFYADASSSALTFTPLTPPGCPTSLVPGEVSECYTSDDVEVRGSSRFAVGTFLASSAYIGSGTSDAMGDPAQSVSQPVDQFRADYTFSTSPAFASSFVDIVAPASADVTLDGHAMTTGEPVGTTTWKIYRASLPTLPSVHRIHATAPVDATVLGYGASTSYMLPAGLKAAPLP